VVRVPAGVENFSLHHRVQNGSGAHPIQPPIQWVPGALSLGVKRPEREADHSPPSSAEVKECVELLLCCQYAYVVWCWVKKNIMINGSMIVNYWRTWGILMYYPSMHLGGQSKTKHLRSKIESRISWTWSSNVQWVLVLLHYMFTNVRIPLHSLISAHFTTQYTTFVILFQCMKLCNNAVSVNEDVTQNGTTKDIRGRQAIQSRPHLHVLHHIFRNENSPIESR
jgi:hypothetical protein